METLPLEVPFVTLEFCSCFGYDAGLGEEVEPTRGPVGLCPGAWLSEPLHEESFPGDWR